MGIIEPEFFARVYRKADSLEDLPWHRTEPPAMLRRAVEARSETGRALDMGAGAGTFAIWLARQGYEVTAVDFVDEALALTRRQAEAAGVDIEIVKADVLDWHDDRAFDLILDSGCLHGMKGRARWVYKAELLRRMKRDGDYVLAHFEKRHPLDWRPMGPRRFPTGMIWKMFRPELELLEHTWEDLSVPLPVGPTIRLGHFWFRQV